MELTQLKYFLKAAELENFTRAAEVCLISQPALSQQMAKLEEELGQPVFDRRGRKVVLTEAGQLLFEHAQQIVSLAESVRSQIRSATERGEGTLQVGAIPTLAPALLPPVLGNFREQYPLARIDIVEDVTESLVASCVRGELDCVFLVLPLEETALDTRTILKEDLLACLPASHSLADASKLRVEDLIDQPFILLNEAHCLTDNVLSFCHRKDFRPAVQSRSSQLATVQELVSLGFGLSIIPAMTAERDNSSSRVYRPIVGAPQRTVVLAWNRHRHQSQLAIDFASIAETTFAS